LQYCARQIAVQRFECDELTNGQTYSVISRKTERTHAAVAHRVQYVPVLRAADGLQRRVLQRARRLSGLVRLLLSAMFAAARESAAIAAYVRSLCYRMSLGLRDIIDANLVVR